MPYQGPAAQYYNPSLLGGQTPTAQYHTQLRPMNTLGGMPPPTPSSASLDSGPAAYNGNIGIAGHISSNFNVEEYSDLCLKVIHEDGKFPETTFYLHKLMVARSETLRELISEYAGNYDSENRLLVKLRVSDRLITPATLEFALRTCYGYAVWNFPGPRDQDEERCEQSKAEMHEALAFTAAGHLLMLEDVVLRGFEVVDHVLDFDSMTLALMFGLEACDHRDNTPESALLRQFTLGTDSQSMVNLNLPITRPPGNEDIPQQSYFPSSRMPMLYQDRSPSTQLRCALDLVKRCIQYVAFYCPDSWALEPSAQPLPIVDRLPALKFRPSPPKSKPLNIQFGELAFDKISDNLNRRISSILLSLPYDCLVMLLRIAPKPIIRDIHRIINERELRREAVVKNEDLHWTQRRLGKDTEWFWVGWREHVNQGVGGLGRINNEPVSIYRTTDDLKEAEKRDEMSREAEERDRLSRGKEQARDSQ